MRVACITLMLSASPLAALDLPSGQAADLHEVLIDAVGQEQWVRFRLVAPSLAEGPAPAYSVIADDLAHLCTTLALPYLQQYALTADVIMVSLSDRITEFGVPDPDAMQFFEAYRPVDNTCIWEAL